MNAINKPVNIVNVTYAQTKASVNTDALGMREMQLSTGAIVLITVLFAGLAIVVSVAIVRGQSVRRDRRRLPAPAEAGAEDA